jgi:hypothetical protein
MLDRAVAMVSDGTFQLAGAADDHCEFRPTQDM